MKRNITIRFSASGKTDPNEWESKVTIDGEGADEDTAEKDAIHKFKAEHGDIPYTVDRNAPLNAAYRILSTVSTEHTTYQLEAGIFDGIDKLKGIGGKAKNALKKEALTQIHHVADNLKITKDAAVLAFKEPKPSNMLRACGYSFATMYGLLHLAHKAAEEGALHVIASLTEHHVLHKVGHKVGHHEKVHKIDDVLKKYPVLKKLTGPALAGVMLYGYALAEPHKLGDWNMENIGKAMAGNYHIGEFLQSAEAVALGAHVATGHVLSLTALTRNVSTLALGLACTAIVNSEHPKLKAIGQKVKGAMQDYVAKKSPLADLKVPEEKLKTAFNGNDPKDMSPKPTKGETPEAEDTKDSAEDKTPEDGDKADKGADTGWWDAMSDEAKEQYIKDHPRTKMEATTRLLASSIVDLTEKIKQQAQKMDKVNRTSPEYLRMQFEMQRLLKELRQLDPHGKADFDYLVWTHSGKPPRGDTGFNRRKGLHAETEDLLLADTEDPLSTGVAFDTLIDGEPSAAEPAVQTVTKDDGTVQEAPEQELLRDDLVVPSIQFG